MNLREYCVGAGHTDHITEEMAKRGYYILGLCGEAGELLEAVTVESKHFEVPYEAGDVLWYCARMLYNLGGMDMVPAVDLNDVCHVDIETARHTSTSIAIAGDICIHAGRISDRQKKIIRDKKGLFSKDDVAFMQENINAVIDALALMAVVRGMKLEMIACMNLGKLASRESRGMIGGNGDHR